MNPWIESHPILVTCPKGIVPWLAGEIRALGYPVLDEGEAAVETEGSLADTMRLNLHLRTAPPGPLAPGSLPRGQPERPVRRNPGNPLGGAPP